MSNNLQNSLTLDDTTEQESTAQADSNSRSVAKRLKALFCCCFKFTRKPPENHVDYNPDEYDYIVEKLLVKRVPIALFAIAPDISNREEGNVTEGTSSSLPSTTHEKKNVYTVQQKDQSPLHHSKTTNHETSTNTSPSSNSHFEHNMITENNEHVSSTDEETCIEKKINGVEILNTLSAFHPDLKESERPPKDPCPLNPPRDKRCFAENISELASVNHKVITDDRNVINDVRAVSTKNYAAVREKPKDTSKLSKDSKPSCGSLLTTNSKSSKPSHISSQQEQNNSEFKQSQNSSLYSGGSRDEDDYKQKEKFVVIPVQLQHVPDNVNKIKKENKNTNLQTTDNTLRSSQISMKTSTAASETARNANASNTVLRWKIIIKHHESETDYAKTAKDINMDENQSKG